MLIASLFFVVPEGVALGLPEIFSYNMFFSFSFYTFNKFLLSSCFLGKWVNSLRVFLQIPASGFLGINHMLFPYTFLQFVSRVSHLPSWAYRLGQWVMWISITPQYLPWLMPHLRQHLQSLATPWFLNSPAFTPFCLFCFRIRFISSVC